MKIEHLNLVVTDIEKSLNFYQTIFPHWKIRNQGRGEWYGKARRWVHFGDEYQYLALSDHGEGVNRKLDGHQIGLAHFCVTTLNLDVLITRLQSKGFKISQEGGKNPHRKNIYFLDPDGFEIEFVEYTSDLPAERNSDSL